LKKKALDNHKLCEDCGFCCECGDCICDESGSFEEIVSKRLESGKWKAVDTTADTVEEKIK
jgi:hypothetical protein